MSLAARQLGLTVEVGVDTSRTALASFSYNFPTAAAIDGDVAKTSTVSECSRIVRGLLPSRRVLLLSGPPCQGFSAAGRRVSRDPRNRVLSAVAKAIVRLSPDAAIVENVSALGSVKHARRFWRFRKILTDGGYNVLVLPLNAAAFGVPQVRHRVICFVTRIRLDETAVKAELAAYETEAPTVGSVLAGMPVPPEYNPLEPALLELPNHVAMRHSERVKQKIASIKEGKGPMSYRRLAANLPARTLISGNRAPPAHHAESRSITVREAARLQGFPDDFEIKGTFANQMTQVTNAVPPPLARAAIGTLLTCLESANGNESKDNAA